MLALVVTVPASEAELASDALWALGVAAIEERTAASTTRDRGPLRRAVDLARQRRRRHHRGGRGASRPAGAGARSRSTRPSPSSWRAHAVPSWVDARPRRRPGVAGPRRPAPACCASTSIPGAAFGLGDHPTTVLDAAPAPRRTLVARRHRARRRLRQRRARGRRGPARRAVRRGDRHLGGGRRGDGRNAERNGVGRRRHGQRPAARRRSTSTFDLVLANLLAPVVVDLAADLRRVRRAVGRARRQRGPRRSPRPRRRGAGADAGRRDGRRGTAGRRSLRAATERGAGRQTALGAHADRGDQAVPGGVALVLALATPEAVLVVGPGEVLARRLHGTRPRTPAGPSPRGAPGPGDARPTTGRTGGSSPLHAASRIQSSSAGSRADVLDSCHPETPSAGSRRSTSAASDAHRTGDQSSIS